MCMCVCMITKHTCLFGVAPANQVIAETSQPVTAFALRPWGNQTLTGWPHVEGGAMQEPGKRLWVRMSMSTCR
jgi:hypothetical protein